MSDSAVLQGKLNIALIRAENLRDADVFGLSDPYAVLNVYQCPEASEGKDGERKLVASFRSLTVENSLNPTWSQSFTVPLGDGREELLLAKGDRSGGALEVDIFDEDNGSRDDFLGCLDSPIQTETMPVRADRPGPEDPCLELPVIHNKNQKGVLFFRCWITLNEETEEEKIMSGSIDMEAIIGATLHLGAVRAVNLRRADVFSESDPYVSITVLGGADLEETGKWESYECDSTRNPHWEDEGKLSFETAKILRDTPDGGHLLVKLMDKDEGTADDELGRLGAPIRISELYFGTTGPKEPKAHPVVWEGEEHGTVYLDLWVEPDAKLARLADFATSKFKEVCEAAASPMRSRWTSNQYQQTILTLAKVIDFIDKAAKDWRIRPLMPCTDAELAAGLSVVDLLTKAWKTKLVEEENREADRKKQLEATAWVEKGWESRVERKWEPQPHLTEHQRWYYKDVHATHQKVQRGVANSAGTFLKEQLFEVDAERAHLGGLKMRRKEARLVGTYLGFATKLVELDLAQNYICDAGVVEIAKSLRLHPTLKMLNLRKNQIMENGCGLLCEALKENAALQIFDLSENRIGNGATVHLCNMLLRNAGLRELFLQGNQISGGKELGQLEQSKRTRLVVKSTYPDKADHRFEMVV